MDRGTSDKMEQGAPDKMDRCEDPFQGRKKHEDANGDHDRCESKNAATDIIRWRHLLAREDLTDRVSEESAVNGTHPLKWP